MEPIRWIRGAVPVAALALVGVGALARPPLLEAADPPWDPPPCPAAVTAPADAAVWFRLDGVVDDAGTLTGQRLAVGRLGAGGRSIDLPPESFATGPWDGRVLVGADDGARSRLSLVDVEASCATVLAEEDAVVRAALVTPDGSAVVDTAWIGRPARTSGCGACRSTGAAPGGSSRGSRRMPATAGRSARSCAGHRTAGWP